MKKYITMDFDDKGAPVIGAAKDNPTQGMAFVPTAWVPGGGGEEGSGLLSISISPELETDPALDSVSPIYYDDLTDDEKENGKSIVLTAAYDVQTDYYITVTPTSNWYAFDPNGMEPGGKGEPVTYMLVTGDVTMCLVASSTEMPPTEGFIVNLTVDGQ